MGGQQFGALDGLSFGMTSGGSDTSGASECTIDMLTHRVILASACYSGECRLGFSRKEKFEESEERRVLR